MLLLLASSTLKTDQEGKYNKNINTIKKKCRYLNINNVTSYMNVHTPGTHFMHLVVVLVVVIDDWNFVSAQSSKFAQRRGRSV